MGNRGGKGVVEEEGKSEEGVGGDELVALPCSKGQGGRVEGLFVCPGASCASRGLEMVWGGLNGIYTRDCSVCACARHAGIIGTQGGTFLVKSVGMQANFVGQPQNGVHSDNYGPWEGIQVMAATPEMLRALVAAEQGRAFALRKSLYAALSQGTPAIFQSAAVRDMVLCTSMDNQKLCRAHHAVFCVGSRACPNRETVYGTQPFTDGSSVCRAARFCGLVKDEGGMFCVEPCGPVDRFGTGQANGVSTTAYDSPYTGFKVLPFVPPPAVPYVFRASQHEAAALPVPLWMPTTISTPRVLTMSAARASPHILGNCLALERMGLPREECALDIFGDSLRIITSSQRVEHLLASLCSIDYFLSTHLLLHFTHGRELLLFSSGEQRREVAMLLRQLTGVGPVAIPQDIWGRIFSFLDNRSWLHAALTCHMFHREAVKQSEERKRGLGSYLKAVYRGTGISISWHLEPSVVALAEGRMPWITLCDAVTVKNLKPGDGLPSYSSYLYVRESLAAPGSIYFDGQEKGVAAVLAYSGPNGYVVAATSGPVRNESVALQVLRCVLVPVATPLVPGRPCAFRLEGTTAAPTHLVFMPERGLERSVPCQMRDAVVKVESLPLKESTQYSIFCVIGSEGKRDRLAGVAPSRVVETGICGDQVCLRLQDHGVLQFACPPLATAPWVGVFEESQEAPSNYAAFFWIPPEGVGSQALGPLLAHLDIPLGTRLECRLYDRWNLVVISKTFEWRGPGMWQ